MMRLLKIMLITLVLCGASVLSASCASKSAPTPAGQVVTVQRGNLVINVIGTGNLALSRTEDLAFEMAGTVQEILVEEADSVEEGQVLAKLDTSEWQDQVTALERQVTQAERQVTTEKRNLIQAKINLNNADLALENAEETSTDDLDIEAKTLAYELAQGRVEDAQLAIEDAQKDLEDAQKSLDEAKSASPEIIAPFAGFITNVNVAGGDEIKKGTVAVQLADPTKFQADILVSEIDISGVKLGGDATAGIDAISGVTLPAKVAFIAPTATIQSGVVNYKVTVEVTSLQPVQSSQAGQGGTSRAATGGQGSQSGQGRTTQPTPGAPVTQATQLRQGLSATVNIPVQEKDNVLLIANRAITRQQGVTYVNVLKSDNTTEKRQIKTGITDGQSTEVTDGLTEGEKVVIPQTTSTTTSTPAPGGEGGFRIPGL